MGDWDEETRTKLTNTVGELVQEAADRAYLIVVAGVNVGEMYKVNDGGETVIGRTQGCGVLLPGEGISRRHARIVALGADLYVEDMESKNGTYVNGARILRHQLSDGDKLQIGETTILKFTYHDNLDESFQRQMFDSALRDGLTKVFNKKYFLNRLESEFAYSHRHHTPLSMIMFDVDHFKKINDTKGHLTGDHVLLRLATTVQAAIRQEDVFSRYGGEEFALICRGIPLDAAQVFAERVRRLIAALNFRHETSEFGVTVSLGVAAMPDPALKEADGLIRNADKALYEAKNAGRNRVVVHRSP